MPKVTFAWPMVAVVLVSACDSTDQTRDIGLDSHPLTELEAGIWIDPNGCHHWIIDDGVEGYMSQRLDPFGRPVCSDKDAPGSEVWDRQVDGPSNDRLF